MQPNHSLEDLKKYHNEGKQFFSSQLMLLKEAIPRIKDDRLAKASVLLMSCGQTGGAILQLATQTDVFTREIVMLARSFIEKVINFCYVGVCEEKEFRAFILHPVYKQYHLVGTKGITDNMNAIEKVIAERKEKQTRLKENPIVQEALAMFSETKRNLSWTKKSLNQRIEALEKWSKMLDVFFTISKWEYYSDASEALHGSLYGCLFNLGSFDPDFDRENPEELEKKLFKDNTCILLHLGMLVHESFTLISYSDDVKQVWEYSYENRGHALNLLFHVLEIKSDNIIKTFL